MTQYMEIEVVRQEKALIIVAVPDGLTPLDLHHHRFQEGLGEICEEHEYSVIWNKDDWQYNVAVENARLIELSPNDPVLGTLIDPDPPATNQESGDTKE